MSTNPQLKSNPLSKEEKQQLLKIAKEDIDAAIAKTKRSINVLIQADVR
jgi:hypothetical protein